MTLSSAEAFAPATVANLGIGFDILGLAVEDLGDTVIATLRDQPGVVIDQIQDDGGKLPREAHRNTAGIAAAAVLAAVHAEHGISLRIVKGLPLCSGLGSSAASAVAAALAANAVLGDPLTREELLPAALEGEAAVSGYHADNVAPCLFGGVTLSYGLHADEIIQLPVPQNLFLTLITPDIEVPTAMARAVLPQSVPMKSMVAQTAGVARLVTALFRGDIEAMASAMESDGIIEPARAHLMPRLSEARLVAKRAGALALVISGAGPTLMAVSADADSAQQAADAVKAVFDEAGIAATARVTRVCENGAYLRL